MSARGSASWRAASPAPSVSAAPSYAPEGAPISGDVARADVLRQRDELLAENAALRARLELMSTLERAAWWDWDVKTERLTAHGDLVELVQLALPADLGAAGLSRWLQLLHPEDVRRARLAFARCVNEPGEIAACPLRVRARGGGYRWVLVALTASGQAAVDVGHARSVFGAARDIHIEKAAQESARRNAQILARIPTGILCADMDGVIGYLNAAAARFLGGSGDWLGRSLFDLVPEPQRQDLRGLAAAVSEGEAAQRVQLEPLVSEGRRVARWLELSSFGDATGKPAGFLCVVGDDTGVVGGRRAAKRDSSTFP